jgi:hypothetical protein
MRSATVLRSWIHGVWLVSAVTGVSAIEPYGYCIYDFLSQVMHRGPIRPGDLAKAMVLDASTSIVVSAL